MPWTTVTAAGDVLLITDCALVGTAAGGWWCGVCIKFLARVFARFDMMWCDAKWADACTWLVLALLLVGLHTFFFFIFPLIPVRISAYQTSLLQFLRLGSMNFLRSSYRVLQKCNEKKKWCNCLWVDESEMRVDPDVDIFFFLSPCDMDTHGSTSGVHFEAPFIRETKLQSMPCRA